MKCTLMTNATLIDADNVETLKRLFYKFQINMDGSEATIHDFYRGKGSYAKTEQAIKLMMVVTKKNIGDIGKLTKKWGSMINFQPLFPTGKKILLKCGVGERQISISFGGDVYPCALLHNPKHPK